ncbi:MAG: type IV secretion system DNA-binding domain-containing protein [Chloroflexi bacterium]|nr:type IV secretion system DNA-binding domain-containing protein [Chloroflexota bacterium]
MAQDILSIRLPRYNAMQVVGPRNLKRAIEDADHASIAWFESMLALMVQTRKREWRLLLSVLSPQEIATLWHLPDETYAGEKIAWAVSNAPDALPKEGADRVVIGEILRGGFSRPVSLAAADRAYHHYVAGKTGTGKSTLLHNLIHQDIAAGRGVAVIDPHGKLVDDILANSIPLERHQDVVLLDCSSDAYPVPLNPFRIPEGVDYDSAFNHVYWVLRRIYSDIWLDGRTDMVMRNVVEALLCDPEATPLDIRRLFTSDEYRQQLVGLMQDHPSVSMDTLDYWEEFAERSKGDKRDIADPVITRTRAFLGNRTLELMTCHKHGLDYSRFIAEKKIVLARLNGRAIAQEVGSLGAMLISGLFLAAEAMAYTPSEADPRMFVYIDEVERFVTTPLPDMLAQARKFGLPLTLANQYLDQLSPETYRAIAGTVGTLTLFEMGLEDAAKFTRLLEPDVTQEALAQLGLYRMAVKTRAHGASVPAFIAAARRAPERRGTPYAETAAQGMTGVEVREWLKTRREKRSEKPDEKPDEPESGQVQAYE